MIRIQDLIRRDCVITDLRAADKPDAIGIAAHRICSANGLDCAEAAIRAIAEREEEMSTGIGCGIAFPHARLDCIDRLYMAAARSVEGIEFDSIDGLAVNLIFMLFSPANSPGAHTEALSALSGMLSAAEVRRGLSRAATADEFIDILAKAENGRADGAP
jgi:mannitol/fructose-specific phosphotransferase system IIA component (Ntr-type)